MLGKHPLVYALVRGGYVLPIEKLPNSFLSFGPIGRDERRIIGNFLQCRCQSIDVPTWETEGRVSYHIAHFGQVARNHAVPKSHCLEQLGGSAVHDQGVAVTISVSTDLTIRAIIDVACKNNPRVSSTLQFLNVFGEIRVVSDQHQFLIRTDFLERFDKKVAALVRYQSPDIQEVIIFY